MWQSVYYYLCYTVLLQLLPVGRPVIQSYDGRYAPLPQPKQGSLIRDDKLQRHRPPSRPPDHHWVEIDIDRASDVGVREWEIGSAIHNEAAPGLLPDDLPQTPAVDAGHLHLELLLLPKEWTGLLLCGGYGRVRSPARVCAYMSSKGIPAHQFYVNGTSGAWRQEPYMDTGEVWSQQKNPPTAMTGLWLRPRCCQVKTTLQCARFSYYSLCVLQQHHVLIFSFHFVFSGHLWTYKKQHSFLFLLWQEWLQLTESKSYNTVKHPGYKKRRCVGRMLSAITGFSWWTMNNATQTHLYPKRRHQRNITGK